eukprot:10025-Heterococcus_DN1.PRE.2
MLSMYTGCTFSLYVVCAEFAAANSSDANGNGDNNVIHRQALRWSQRLVLQRCLACSLCSLQAYIVRAVPKRQRCSCTKYDRNSDIAEHQMQSARLRRSAAMSASFQTCTLSQVTTVFTCSETSGLCTNVVARWVDFYSELALKWFGILHSFTLCDVVV